MDPTGAYSNFRTGIRFTLVQPGSHFQVQESETSRSSVSSRISHKDPSLPPNKLTRTYACAECGLSTTRSRMFLLHQIVSHASTFNFHLFLCPHCEYASRWRQKLVRHSEILHGSHPTAPPLTPSRIREQFESVGRDLDLLLAWTHSHADAVATSVPIAVRPSLNSAMPSQVPIQSLLIVPSGQSQASVAPLDLSIKRSPSASASADADSPQAQTPPASDAPASECPPPPVQARSNKRKNKAPQRVAEPSAASPEPELLTSSSFPLAERQQSTQQPQDSESDELMPLNIAEPDESLEGESLDNPDAETEADADLFPQEHLLQAGGVSLSPTIAFSAGAGVGAAAGGGGPLSPSRLRCGQCGYLAPHPSKLRSHLAAHANLRAYMCSICGVRSNWPSDIRFSLFLFALCFCFCFCSFVPLPFDYF